MKLSIITINFNDRKGLEQTIKSVILQTFQEYEFIIIDGGSTDGSADCIKQFEGNIDYWISEPDRGIFHAMNKGVAQAHGDYSLFLNSGDTFFENGVLDKIANIGLKDDIVVGKLVSKTDGRILFNPPSRPISMYYLFSSTVPHQSAFIKTELLRVYPYDENLKIVSDWKFFVQAIVIHNCSIRYIDVIISIFDVDGLSTSNPDRMWEEKEKVLCEMFPPRILVDYQHMKKSECLIQTIAPQLRQHYTIDKILYRIGVFLVKLVKRK